MNDTMYDDGIIYEVAYVIFVTKNMISANDDDVYMMTLT